MSGYSEKRLHKRVDAKVKVVFKTLKDLVHEYTHNISGGGIFIKTDKLLDPNAEIELEMSFPDDLGHYVLKGKVTRLMSLSDPNSAGKQLYGVGVRFINPDPKMIDIIEKTIVNSIED
ncbi:MAG TPA: PilZ domain-containing protein [Oligoflexia bacterium]|nr:PilZ domain-containing protein [Oligoflexia bacterium]HMR24414.1 PilZ domain-containing protein [Oligoflexia bacterium]